jgi:hypothetical protein
MRTKTLLIAAAALVAGVISSEAQVYSANVVGYVNIPLTEGFNLIANPLDVDGTGTNNTLVGFFTNSLPVNSAVYLYNGSGYTLSTYAANKSNTATNWTVNAPLNPGQGFWVSIPAGSFGGATNTITAVGTVLQGSLSNPNLTTAGFALVSSQVPIAGDITTNLNYIPSKNDAVYVYSGGGYNLYTYAANKSNTATNWNPSAPQISVGQGFWINSQSGSPWTNNFIVQ